MEKFRFVYSASLEYSNAYRQRTVTLEGSVKRGRQREKELQEKEPRLWKREATKKSEGVGEVRGERYTKLIPFTTH